MRAALLTIVGLGALLAGCSDQPGEKAGDIAATDAMSKAEVKAAVDKVQLKPGEWEGRFTIKDIDLSAMPGAPEGMETQMKNMMSQTSLRYCITPEEAANPSGRMFAGQNDQDCTFAGFEASGGTVKGQVSCKAEDGRMNAAMTGTYAADRYAIDMDMKMDGGPQGASMAMTARSEGTWIKAECTPKE